MQAGVAKLADIVRGDFGRHSDCYSARAVGEQVREGGRHYDRLRQSAVVIRSEIDRVLVQAVHQSFGGRGQSRFGVPGRRGIVAVDVAEVPLAVDQRISEVEILSEAHKGVVYRLIAVRMEIAHDIAGDLGRFPERSAGAELQFAHRVKDAPVDRLQSVPGIRKGAVHDRGQRILQVALLDRLLKRLRAIIYCEQILCHAFGL